MKYDLIGHRYRLDRKIGEGGMAQVFIATDEKLGRSVAIKILNEHLAQNEAICQRFQQEAQAISSLDHPNILKIYDFSGMRSERLWIVTEYIHGKNLAQILNSSPEGNVHHIIATCVVREVCRALDKAHSQGIIHRDVKPENVMITSEGIVKLMDFGIAKNLGSLRQTATGTFMGSPSYMSPEQVRGKGIDHRTDVYSLCVLFYELVTGQLPFDGQGTHDVVLKIVEGVFTPPRALNEGLPEILETLILKGMSKEAHERFGSVAELGEQLDVVISAQGLTNSQAELEMCFKDPLTYGQRLARIYLPPLPSSASQDKTSSPQVHSPKAPSPKLQSLEPAIRKKSESIPLPQKLPQQPRTRIPSPPSHLSPPVMMPPLRRPPPERIRIVYRTVEDARPKTDYTLFLLFVAIAGLLLFVFIDANDRVLRSQGRALLNKFDPPQVEIPEVPSSFEPEVVPRPTPSLATPSLSAISTPLPKAELAPAKKIPKKASLAVVTSFPHRHGDYDRPAKPEPKADPVPHVMQERAKPTPAEVPRSTKGFFAVASQPASEIFINGKRFGTTNEMGLGSRWIELPAGKHRLELKRSGYEPWVQNFQLAADEKKRLGILNLKKDESTDRIISYKLTINVNVRPVQITIRKANSDAGAVHQNMDGLSKTFMLEKGIYDITLEHDGQKKNKRVHLTGSSLELTFTMEFK